MLFQQNCNECNSLHLFAYEYILLNLFIALTLYSLMQIFSHWTKDNFINCICSVVQKGLLFLNCVQFICSYLYIFIEFCYQIILESHQQRLNDNEKCLTLLLHCHSCH